MASAGGGKSQKNGTPATDAKKQTRTRGESMKLFQNIKRLFKDEQGISAVEYALLLALIGGGIATAAFLLGDQVEANITTATGNLSQ